MIRPTLFVGLGTTGTKILKDLRRLLFEEYGHAGLPVFRFISIETDGDEKGEDTELQLTNQIQDYERITVVNATIESTSPIQHKLTPSHPRHDRHLAEWLNPELLKVETHSFETGAKNIRMAGRLCLWENWHEMKQKVTAARDAIIAQDTTDKTREMLARYYQSKGRQLPQGRLIDDDAINAYIVGSLCGGSCSGMLTDVAYFFRSLFAGQQSSKIYGIFTMYDKDQATGQAADINVRSANCYASLLELNYYNHTDTTYDMTFPTGDRVEDIRRKPFDYATFVSRSSKIPNIKHVLPNGGFDEDGLNLMVALNLFSEAAGDTDGEKEAIRTDWESYEGVWGMKDVSKGEIPLMVKHMASFGLTAVWYPKYRIASASASLVSKKLCQLLSGKHVSPAITLADAKAQWNSILRSNMDILVTPEGQQSLRGRIESELNRLTSSAGLQNTAAQDSFRQKFDAGGEYADLIKVQIPECEAAYHNAIEEVLNNKLGVIDFEGKSGLGDVQAFFEALDKEIEQTIQDLPDRMSAVELKLDWTPIERSEKSLWTKLIGLHKLAVTERREELINNFQARILGHKESAYQKLRNYYLRPVLQKIRTQLGYGVQPSDADSSNPMETIKQKLDRMASNLNTCIQTFQNNYNSAISPRYSASVKIVTDNPENKIEIDAEALSHKIDNMLNLGTLLGNQSMSSFLAESHGTITSRMMETYRRLSLEQIPVKDVVTKSKHILDVGGDENDIISMASRSNPYQTFHRDYNAIELGRPPKIICGDDSNKDALTDLRNSLSGKERHFPRIGGSSVDHLLFFYEEEAGFAFDDLDAYDMLERHFLRKPGIYGHSTHQDSDFYDLALYHKIQKLQRWCRALSRLVPEICKHINTDAFTGIFYHTKNGYVYEYNIDGLPERIGLNNDQDGIKRLSRKQNETAYASFFNVVRSNFTHLDRQEVTQLIKSMLRGIEDNNTHASVSNFYRQFLEEVYSHEDSIDNTESDSDLDSYFSQTIPQARADTPTDEPDETPSEPSQNMNFESTPDATEDSDGYEEVISESEENEPDVSFLDQSDTQQTGAYVENTPSQDATTEVNEDEVVWTEAEPDSTEIPAEEATVEEPLDEKQPQLETKEQKEQPQSSKEFSVADVDVEKVSRRGSPRKKE